MPKKRKQRVIVPHQMTRGQLSRHQRELQQQRYLYYGMAGVVALILVIFGAAALNQFVLKPAQLEASLKTVLATVGNEQITRATYNKRRNWDLFNQIRTQQYYQSIGAQTQAQDTTAQLEQQLIGVATEQVDQTTLDSLIDNAVLEQKAGTLGVNLTADDIKAEALKDFVPQPTPIPVPSDTPTITPVTPPPTATQTPTPTVTPRTPQPSPTYTPTQTNTPGPSPTQTSTPTITNTPIPVPGGQQTATADYGVFINSIKNGLTPVASDPFCGSGCPGLTEQDYLDLIVKPQLLQKQVTDKLQSSVVTTTEQIHAAHILIMVKSDQNSTGTHTDAEAKQIAQNVLDQLNKGADFATLAKQYSEDTSNKDQGGDLGWFLPTEKGGPMVQAFSDAAYKLTKPGELSPLVQSQFGYHIIKLIERGQHPLDATALQTAKDSAYTNWLNAQKASITILVNGVPATPPPAATQAAQPTTPPAAAVTNPPITGPTSVTNTNAATGTQPASSPTPASATNPVTSTNTITK